MKKENLEHIASALMAQAESSDPDTNYCGEDEVYNAIGPELASNFGLELLVCHMRNIKQDNFGIDYVESLQTALQAMSDFLAEEMEARAKLVIMEDLVWDVINY